MDVIVEITKAEMQQLGNYDKHKLQSLIWDAVADAIPDIESKVDFNVTIKVGN
jgi:hypothetical protein